MPEEPSKDPSPFAMAGVGLELVITVAFFVYAGNYLDGYFQKANVFTLIGLFLGFGLGFYSLIVKVKNLK